jgi:alginate O-acetyltransferase complex protein AlgI
MVFSSPTFLFAFLPATLLAYLMAPARARNGVLLVASAAFYVWGAGAEVAAILCVAGVSFVGALYATTARRTVAVVSALLVPLAVYKYLPITDAALPLGISFFTFHAISYVVDARRGRLPGNRRLRHYLLYLFLFPHQIAGPIVRYSEIGPELTARREVTLENAAYGLTRFAWGLAKKACVADSAGLVADAAFAAPPGTVNTTTAWIGAVAYAVQIYFDFSGYSDMAIGLAALFGFRFPENFRAPYRSLGPADFWRRWHRTLSRWFRDYVYIPLGGNRHGRRREYAALLVTFLLTALWHGATWPFLVWGGLHAAALLLERTLGLRDDESFRGARRSAMALFVVLSWVPFRSADVSQTLHLWQAMTSWQPGAPAPSVLVTLTPWTLTALGVGLLAFVGPRDRTGFEFVHGLRLEFRVPRALVTAPLLLVIALISVLWLDFSPFLYFQF